MKILILSNYDIGLYRFRKELIEELLKKNEVFISLPYGESVDPLIKMGCTFLDTAVDRRGINPVVDIKLFRNYKKILKKENPDLVITYTIKPNVYGGFACRLLKIPYAANITGLGTAFQNKGLLRKLVTFMYRGALKKAKTIFFENSENQQIFIDEHIIKENQSYLLNGAGVNLEYFRPAEYPDDTKTTKFLFIGRVMKEKGIDELLEAMRLLYARGVGCFLDVVGGCEEDYSECLKHCEAEGWLKYHGFKKDVRPFIAGSHCFVLPSWHEGMANTNLECAAMSRPVITSNISGCREAVKNNVSGYLCKKRDLKDLYRTMKQFTELSYTEKKAMGIAGRHRMEDIFDKKGVVKETLKGLDL